MMPTGLCGAPCVWLVHHRKTWALRVPHFCSLSPLPSVVTQLSALGFSPGAGILQSQHLNYSPCGPSRAPQTRGWPGQAAAAHSGTISLSFPRLPPPPCHIAAVQQGLPGTERHVALNDIFALILHAVMSLLPPTITIQYIKNMAKACH